MRIDQHEVFWVVGWEEVDANVEKEEDIEAGIYDEPEFELVWFLES